MDGSRIGPGRLRARAFDYDWNLAKLGQPFDRTEWAMTPQTVNAHYDPERNDITFPAAVLQPPFFNLDADDAVSYGAIGTVIAHEISHGFDDEGSSAKTSRTPRGSPSPTRPTLDRWMDAMLRSSTA